MRNLVKSAGKPCDQKVKERVHEQVLAALKEMLVNPDGFLVRNQAIVAAERIR